MTSSSVLSPSAKSQRSSNSLPWIAWLVSHRELGLLLVLVLLISATTLANPHFASWQNVQDVLLNVAIIGILTTGMTVVMVMRHIDLSISSTVGISAYAVGSVFVAMPECPIALAILIGVLLGMVAGYINGLLVTVGNVPSLVATIGTLYIFRGVDYAWVQGGQIHASSLPEAFSFLGSGSLLGVPVLVFIALLVIAATGWYLKHFRGGREFYAIGSNPEAAILAGIRVKQRVLKGFVLAGALAGLAGALWLARFGTVEASTAKGIELQVVAAAVVGSVAITGGVGNVWGATLGALLLGVINLSLVVLRVSPFWQLSIQGALIVAAIALDTLLARSVAKWMMRKRDHDQH